jgi:hypothetical protein
MKTPGNNDKRDIRARREAELNAEQQIRGIREAKLERAFNRLAQFQLQAVPALTLKSGPDKCVASIGDDGSISRTSEPIEAGELRRLDEAIASISDMARLDIDLVDEVEARVFGEAIENIGDRNPSDRESIEQLKYVTELEDSVSEVFGSYDEAIEWEQEDFGHNEPEIER